MFYGSIFYSIMVGASSCWDQHDLMQTWWRELLGSFDNVKTMLVLSSLVWELFSSLLLGYWTEEQLRSY